MNASLLRAVCFVACALLATVVNAQSRAEGEFVADGLYSRALSQIEGQRYSQALATLRQVQIRFPNYTKIAGVQTRIAVLQESADAGESLRVFLSALTLRDNGNMDAALVSLGTIASYVIL